MSKFCFLFTVLLLAELTLLAQTTREVPQQIRFADMRLNLTNEARKKIQTDVDALMRFEKYFDAKVKKVDTYLPLIEKVLREENVPDDIKYLVIQESALVGDAVSSSNAVGYWQFKAPTGREVGLTINDEVDERMNIITATRGAARYFKNNNTYFDNWLYALLAYYAGPGGALKIADKKYYSKREMKLDGNTHWYVIKFLAHMIAFEDAVNKNERPGTMLFTYTEGNGKTLAEIAQEFNLTVEDLAPYNKWIRKRRIPDDQMYYVIIPDYSGQAESPLLAGSSASQEQRETQPTTSSTQQTLPAYIEVDDTRRFPVVRQGTRWGNKLTLVNNIPGTVAQSGDNIRNISQRTGVSASRLVRYNDLNNRQADIVPGKPYYLKPKRNRAQVRYHVVENGENLWSISQRFGIKLRKLMRNNRMNEIEDVQAGRVLWLRYIRPPDIPIEYRSVPNRQNTTARVSKETDPRSIRMPQPTAQQTTRVVKPKTNTNTQSETPEYIGEASSELSGMEPPATTEARPQEAEKEEPLQPVINRKKTLGKRVDYHSVQKGETLYSIARKYGLTIPQLTTYNDIEWEVPLVVGQELRLAPQEEEYPDVEGDMFTEGAYHIHMVGSGETLYSIARQYEVTIKDLMEWNNKEDFDVSIDEKLRVLKK